MMNSKNVVKVFSRFNRAWIADIIISNNKFLIRDKAEQTWSQKLSKKIEVITRRQSRLKKAIHKNSQIIEIFKNSVLEAKEENFPILIQQLSYHFPFLRFIEIDENKLTKDKLVEANKKMVAEASYLKDQEREKLLKMIEGADINELVLIKSDLEVLERMSRMVE